MNSPCICCTQSPIKILCIIKFTCVIYRVHNTYLQHTIKLCSSVFCTEKKNSLKNSLKGKGAGKKLWKSMVFYHTRGGVRVVKKHTAFWKERKKYSFIYRYQDSSESSPERPESLEKKAKIKVQTINWIPIFKRT